MGCDLGWGHRGPSPQLSDKLSGNQKSQTHSLLRDESFSPKGRKVFADFNQFMDILSGNSDGRCHGFVAIQGPIQEEAELSACVLAGDIGTVGLGGSLGAERNSLCVLLAVAAVNVVLGIWRPRFTKLPD
jgi:hypothetical protein